MKTRSSGGLFPHRKGPRRTNAYGGSAGNSSSNSKPGPGTSDYDRGFTGERGSRMYGGESMLQSMRNRPLYSDKSTPGDGGCAWDSSMSPYMKTPARGPKPY